MEHNVDPSKR